ncbi:MAG TPA: hypothetical protein VM166_04070 [Gemmatimonadaceae bacterium]|nr:hypothetical protein [Gemmatimonadaceae bacterium]
MKRIAYTLSLVAATAMAAAPLAAQSGNGPWWDPGRTQTRSSQGGSVYDRDGSVYSQQADGQWRADSRDRNGNTIYVRTRYDSDGRLVREWATRNIIGRYNVIDRQYLDDRRSDNGRYGNDRDVYDSRGTYDNRGVYDRRAQEARIKREQKIRREQIKLDEKYRREQLKLEERRIKEQEKYRREELKRRAQQNRRYENNGRDHGKKEGWSKNGKR